jgi:hypothetical protein
MGSVRS